MGFYEELYKPVFFHSKSDGRRIVGKENNHCRYCGQTKQEGRGWNLAHVLPAFFENNELFSADECSSCNDLFGCQYDDHLAKLTKFFHAVTGVRGRKGVPTAKSGNGLRIEHTLDGVTITNPKTTADSDDRSLTLRYRSEPHSRFAAWKGLVKPIFALISIDLLGEFEATRRMLLNPQGRSPIEPCMLLIAAAPWGRLKDKYSVFLFEKANAGEEYPKFIAVYYVAGMFYHVPIYSDNQIANISRANKSFEVSIPPLTDSIETLKTGPRKPKLLQIDMTSSDQIRDEQTVTVEWTERHDIAEQGL